MMNLVFLEFCSREHKVKVFNEKGFVLTTLNIIVFLVLEIHNAY